MDINANSGTTGLPKGVAFTVERGFQGSAAVNSLFLPIFGVSHNTDLLTSVLWANR